MQIYVWGVDSAVNVTEELFQCVLQNFGYPGFWGRYLVRVQGLSEGLAKPEISFIHNKGIKLLPIYNSIQEAKGYYRGRAAANNAAFYAQNLSIPKGIPIFADIEPHFQIDDEWIQGWTDEIILSGYKSGIYNFPVTGGFNTAFCNAVKENKQIKTLNILWSAEPELEPSGLLDAPDYKPAGPVCGGNVWAWQYSRKVTSCPIDTNLAGSELVNILW